jgi:hypothetical protein
MCMQCMAGAMAAGTAAVSTRQLLLARAGAWMTARRRTILSTTLIVAGILVSGLISGSAAPS